MIACVIGKCLVMAEADLFIICRQRAPDTENPIWITQLIRITSHRPGLATTNCNREKKCVQYHREKLLVQKKPGTDIKKTEFIVEIFQLKYIFPNWPQTSELQHNQICIRPISLNLTEPD